MYMFLSFAVIVTLLIFTCITLIDSSKYYNDFILANFDKYDSCLQI